MKIKSFDNTPPETDDATPLLRKAKFVARLAAIGATVGGAVIAFFSSSATSGAAITAAGASTLAAAEKIPDPKSKYLKTKHIPPRLADKLNPKKKPSTPEEIAKALGLIDVNFDEGLLDSEAAGWTRS